VQAFVATQQALADLNRRRVCPACGQRYHSKDAGTHTIKTVFGPVRSAQSAVGALRLPERRAAHLSSSGSLAAKGHGAARSCSIWRPSGPH
jgi:hypothetical protein